MIAFFTLLVFSLYGIILYGKSASSYIRQSNSIETIKSTYSKDISNAGSIAESIGATYHIEN